jgi:N-acetyl-anhydromuramoyl-L-alanine amidase
MMGTYITPSKEVFRHSKRDLSMHVNAKGWVEFDLETNRSVESQAKSNLRLFTCQHAPSPHFDQRPNDVDIDLLVMHNISLPPGEFGGGYVHQLFAGTLDSTAHAWFENLKGVRVSAHFLIEREGHITQFVSCHDRAWHAGVSTFDGRQKCNDFSIGIELEGTDNLPYTEHQYAALALLTAALKQALPLKSVRGHCHIAPERKTDPGTSFDWSRYAREAKWTLNALP